jgi:glycosyltransferase involved in cell wall biosynthesis
VYSVFGARRAIAPLSQAAGLWWHRHWHASFLENNLRRSMKPAGSEIIYAQCPLAARAALNARTWRRQQVVMAVHFNLSQAEEWVEKGVLRRSDGLYRSIRESEAQILPRLDGLVFVSEFMRSHLHRILPGISRIPSAVIRNFVADPGATGVRDAVDAELISIGSLEPRKNQAYLLEILAAASAAGTPLRATLVGDGPDRRALELRAERLGVRRLVRFAGYVPEAARLLPRHRAYIHTATMENMPLALMEALASGLPVFAPAVGGIPEIIQDGVQGRLLPLDDPREAASRLLDWLARTPASVAAQASRRRYAEEFSAAAGSLRLERFLDGIAAGMVTA